MLVLIITLAAQCVIWPGLFIPRLTTMAKLMRPGGSRTVAAESLLLKPQLIMLNRCSERASKFRPVDRVIAGLCKLYVRPFLN